MATTAQHRPAHPARSTTTARPRETLAVWLASGVLTVDDEPALYVYEEAGAIAASAD